jgi:hypothetical protein
MPDGCDSDEDEEREAEIPVKKKETENVLQKVHPKEDKQDNDKENDYTETEKSVARLSIVMGPLTLIRWPSMKPRVLP